MMPHTTYKHITPDSVKWDDLVQSGDYIFTESIPVAGEKLEVYMSKQATKLAQIDGYCKKGVRLRIISLDLADTYNGQIYTANCKILSGGYRNKILRADYIPDNSKWLKCECSN